MHIGDSGDELAEVSVIDEASKGEVMVVGDESVESDADEDTLSQDWAKCLCAFTEDCNGASKDWKAVESILSIEPDSPPKTGVKEGNAPGMEGVEV